MSLGKQLKRLREIHGYTQRELAKLLCIANSTLAMYETNKREPDNVTLGKIADFFGVTTDYILGRTDIHNSDESSNKLTKEVDENTKKEPPQKAEATQIIKDMFLESGLIEKGKPVDPVLLSYLQSSIDFYKKLRNK